MIFVIPCAELVHEPSENGVVVNGWRRAAFRLGAAAGIAGPAAFTGAWIASSLRQTRHGPGGLQLSGLAAPDARDPAIMLAGFVVAGGCTVAFGAALRRALRGDRHRRRGVRPGPDPGCRAAVARAGPSGQRRRADRHARTAPGQGHGLCRSAATPCQSADLRVYVELKDFESLTPSMRNIICHSYRPWLLLQASVKWQVEWHVWCWTMTLNNVA